jgi:hypothetical protein
MKYTPLVRPIDSTDTEFFALCKRTNLVQSLKFMLTLPRYETPSRPRPSWILLAADLLSRAVAELDRRPKLKQSTKALRDEYTTLVNGWRAWHVSEYGWGASREEAAA